MVAFHLPLDPRKGGGRCPRRMRERIQQAVRVEGQGRYLELDQGNPGRQESPDVDGCGAAASGPSERRREEKRAKKAEGAS